MTTRSRATFSGLVALAKCAVLLGGVPVALARLWALAPSAPRASEPWLARATIDHLVIALVAALWGAAAVRLVRDVARALDGRLASPSRSWSARWATRVAGLLLVLGSGLTVGASAAYAAPSLASPPVAAHAETPAVASGDPSPAVRSYVVRPGDCLASIAARLLGDAAEWTTLWRLNQDRHEPDGRRLVDPSLVYPGWVLAIPSAPGAPVVSRRAGSRTMPRATTERSAAERSSTGLPRRRVVAARRTERALEVTRHPDPPSTGPHPGGIPVRGLAELGILGLGMLTTAALARKIRSSRRSTECMRRPGERAAEGDPHTASAAAALDPLADTTLLDWVDGANRLLTRALRDRRGALPEVRLVRAGPDGVELLLDAPVVDPPEGFLSRDGGWTWVLDPDIALADLLALVDGFRRHVPALVPIGDSAEASYLAAVGPRRHLLLRSADGAPLRPHLDAMVTALCTLPWASALQVELLGVDPPPGSRCDHTVAPSSASELVALARSPLPDAADRAVRSEPQHVLVVLDGPPADALGPDLRAAIGERAGIVTTSVRGGPEIAVTVVVEHGALVVLPDGVELLARSPTALQAALADDLLDRPLLVRPAAPAPGVASTGRPSRRAGPGQVEICVLAPVPSLTGLASPLASKDRSRVVELVAYLALAGHGATTDAIREQVFGRSDRVASLGRVHNVASAARSALGTDEEGRFLLPASSGGRYRLDERVTCDWTRFEQMSTRARTSSVPEAIELLAGALDLVGGLPCSESPSGWDWLVSRGLLTTMVSSVVDASHHLASLAIAGRELDLASWAVSKGRIVEPCSEMLARDAMILADLSGDPDALRREWHDLEAGLAILDGGEPSEETRALYEELAGSRRATSPRRRSARNG